MKIEEKKKLLEDYLNKCPFIEFHSIVELNAETATIDVAFDEEKIMQYKYIVWVGGVDDYYTDLNQAIKHFKEWIEKGYDEVAIECIGRKEK